MVFVLFIFRISALEVPTFSSEEFICDSNIYDNLSEQEKLEHLLFINDYILQNGIITTDQMYSFMEEYLKEFTRLAQESNFNKIPRRITAIISLKGDVGFHFEITNKTLLIVRIMECQYYRDKDIYLKDPKMENRTTRVILNKESDYALLYNLTWDYPKENKTFEGYIFYRSTNKLYQFTNQTAKDLARKNFVRIMDVEITKEIKNDAQKANLSVEKIQVLNDIAYQRANNKSYSTRDWYQDQKRVGERAFQEEGFDCNNNKEYVNWKENQIRWELANDNSDVFSFFDLIMKRVILPVVVGILCASLLYLLLNPKSKKKELTWKIIIYSLFILAIVIIVICLFRYIS